MTMMRTWILTDSPLLLAMIGQYRTMRRRLTSARVFLRHAVRRLSPIVATCHLHNRSPARRGICHLFQSLADKVCHLNCLFIMCVEVLTILIQ
jgi:hypothetical protein